MTPVDDRDAAAEVRAFAEQDLLLAAVLAEAQVAEVRRLDAHPRLRARGPQLLEQRRVAVPLLEQRRLVLGLGAVAQRFLQPLELVDERALRRRRACCRARRVERLTPRARAAPSSSATIGGGVAGRHEDLV